MKTKLVFYDWIDAKGESIYGTETGFALSRGDLHAGSTFDCEILLDDEQEVLDALAKGFRPCFYISK